MKWILVLVYLVLNSVHSRADGQVQLTVDVPGEAETSVNIRPQAPDCPQEISNKLLQRKKRASAPVRPFSVETDDMNAYGDYSNPSAPGSTVGSTDYATATTVGDQSNFQPSPANNVAGGPATSPMARQPPMGGGMNGGMSSGGMSGGMGGMGGMGGGPPFGGGPNGRRPQNNRNRRNQGRRCPGPGCRGNQGDFGRRRQGNHRPQYDDYSSGNYGQAGPAQRGARNQRIQRNQRNPQNQRMNNPQAAPGSSATSNYNY